LQNSTSDAAERLHRLFNIEEDNWYRKMACDIFLILQRACALRGRVGRLSFRNKNRLMSVQEELNGIIDFDYHPSHDLV